MCKLNDEINIEDLGEVQKIFIYRNFPINYKAVLQCENGFAIGSVEYDNADYKILCYFNSVKNYNIELTYDEMIIMPPGIYVLSEDFYSSEGKIDLSSNSYIYLDIERDLHAYDKDDEDYVDYETTYKTLTLNVVVPSIYAKTPIEAPLSRKEALRRLNPKDESIVVYLPIELDELLSETKESFYNGLYGKVFADDTFEISDVSFGSSVGGKKTTLKITGRIKAQG